MTKSIITLTVFLMNLSWCGPVEAKFGWAEADIVMDFGLEVEPGDRQVVIKQAEVGHPFHVDVVWKLHPENCLIQTLQDGDVTPEWRTIQDDQLFTPYQAHAIASNIKALAVAATKDHPCSMNPQKNNILVLSEIKHSKNKLNEPQSSAALGATVMVFRATSFFTPTVITIHAGERVVWIYADGVKEPHTVTSGACRGTDCTGGGTLFDSGKTLNKAGQRFEHVFKHPGTFPYHCDLHTASMTGTVIVKP